MSIQEKSTVIIADDLTGANDTALQYFCSGIPAKVIIDSDYDIQNDELSQKEVFAYSTESRNLDKKDALDCVIEIANKVKKNFNSVGFYKKIDSTLRGNVGIEIFALLEIMQKDAAIVAPAYIEEKRTTIGSYQLLNGIPIERTQAALDPKSPVCESYIPNILKKDINPQLFEHIDSIRFDRVAKGAGPLSLKIKELIQKGKKIIVLDAVSTVDLEQISLAIEKSGYDILPVGSAGLARAISKKRKDDSLENKKEHIKHCPEAPCLIVSGSATKLTKNQIQKLTQEKECLCVNLELEDVLENKKDFLDLIYEKLSQNINVVIHSSFISGEEANRNENIKDNLTDAGISKIEFANMITEYLSDLVYEINKKQEFILVMIGGETSFKSLKKLDSKYLQIVDDVLPAIPLCVDSNGKIIVTKSGNFGTANTLIEIVNYFEKLKNEKL